MSSEVVSYSFQYFFVLHKRADYDLVLIVHIGHTDITSGLMSSRCAQASRFLVLNSHQCALLTPWTIFVSELQSRLLYVFLGHKQKKLVGVWQIENLVTLIPTSSFRIKPSPTPAMGKGPKSDKKIAKPNAAAPAIPTAKPTAKTAALAAKAAATPAKVDKKVCNDYSMPMCIILYY